MEGYSALALINAVHVPDICRLLAAVRRGVAVPCGAAARGRWAGQPQPAIDAAAVDAAPGGSASAAQQ